MVAHPRVRLRGDAAHQRAHAQRALHARAQVHVLHTQNLVPQIGHGVMAPAAGYRRRLRLPAVCPQRLAQAHIRDAAGEENRRADQLVDGLLVQQGNAGRAVKVARVAGCPVAGPIRRDAGRLFRRYVAQGGNVLAVY